MPLDGCYLSGKWWDRMLVGGSCVSGRPTRQVGDGTRMSGQWGQRVSSMVGHLESVYWWVLHVSLVGPICKW